MISSRYSSALNKFFVLVFLFIAFTFALTTVNAGTWRSTGSTCTIPTSCHCVEGSPGGYCSNIGKSGLLMSNCDIVLFFYITGEKYRCVPSCNSYDHKSCYNGDVYWYDSCGNRGSKANECGSSYCDTGGDVYRYCSGGDVYGTYDYLSRGCSGSSCYSNWNYNSCGNTKLEDCGTDETCSGGQCVSTCTSQDYKSCYNGDVYWYDSCDNRGNVAEDCSTNSTSCNYGTCGEDERPSWSCSGSSCDYTCNYTSTCCTSRDYKSCYNGDVYWYDSCDNRESTAEDCASYENCSSGQCVCNESCSLRGYECGSHNICGSITSCGTCGQGLICNAGTCEVADPELRITADPEMVRNKGGGTTVEWYTENYADSCEVTGPDFYETGIAGSETTTVESQETYTLTCINNGKQFTDSITIQLAPSYREY